MRSEVAQRVVSLCALCQFNAVVFKLSYSVCRLIVKIHCKRHHESFLCSTLKNLFFILIYDFGYFGAHFLYLSIGLFIGKLRRPHPQSVAGGAGGKFFAVSVVYDASLCLNGRVVCLLKSCLFRVFLRVYNLYPRHPEGQDD